MLGKYRIRRRIGAGAFATVYEAYDTIEGIPVALKIPNLDQLDKDSVSAIHREVRLTARLEHENILPLRNAMMIDDRFVIATPLGEQALTDRMRYRLGPKTALSYTEQLIDALAYAHEVRVIHCDIKPDNVILFPDGQVRLADFGIAKVALRTRTIMGSGQGTVGYIAPEQAMGKPSFRSDVFSMGLLIYRMFAGELPAWPFEWPVAGRRTASPHSQPRFRQLPSPVDRSSRAQAVQVTACRCRRPSRPSRRERFAGLHEAGERRRE